MMVRKKTTKVTTVEKADTLASKDNSQAAAQGKGIRVLTAMTTAECLPDDVFVEPGVRHFRHTIQSGPDDPPSRVTDEIGDTDAYDLILVNCGSKTNGKIAGKVVMTYPYGYLPGVEFPKISFYGWFSIIYVTLLAVWIVRCCLYRSQLIRLHWCIMGVVFLGLLESALWYGYYVDWNASGSRNPVLLILSIVTSVSENISAFMLVLVASLGWGITRSSLERSTQLKIQAFIFLYVLLDAFRQTVTQFRFSSDVGVALMMACIIPISILHGVLFFWIFSALTATIEELDAAKQTEKSTLFTRFWTVLVIALSISILFLFVQIFVFNKDPAEAWQVQWWFSDAIPHTLFMIVLIAVMWLWAPSVHSKRYAYVAQLPTEEDGVELGAKRVFSDDDDVKNTTEDVRVHVWGDDLDIDEESDPDDTF